MIIAKSTPSNTQESDEILRPDSAVVYQDEENRMPNTWYLEASFVLVIYQLAVYSQNEINIHNGFM